MHVGPNWVARAQGKRDENQDNGSDTTTTQRQPGSGADSAHRRVDDHWHVADGEAMKGRRRSSYIRSASKDGVSVMNGPHVSASKRSAATECPAILRTHNAPRLNSSEWSPACGCAALIVRRGSLADAAPPLT